MATIKTQEDWWNTAKSIIPRLPDYMNEFNGGISEEKVLTELNSLVENHDHNKLWSRFEEIWAWLPDRPDIHHGPFGDLCDLCSEYWVFQE